jgi:hypothetical protein
MIFFLSITYNHRDNLPPTHTHTHIRSSQSEMQNSYLRCPFFSIVILLYCWPIKILTQNLYLRFFSLQFYNMIILQFASILLGQ